MEMECETTEGWEARLERKMLSEVHEGVRKWCAIVRTLGLDDKSRDEWADMFRSEVTGYVNDCVAEAGAKQNELLTKIELLLEKSQELCKSLNIKLPRFESTNRGYYHDEKYLIEQIKVWQEELDERMIEVDKLKASRDEISKTLGIAPFFVRESPLPNKEELAMYIKKVEEMQAERDHRQEKFIQLKFEVAELANEIEYEPKLDFERVIIYGVDDNCDVSDQNMERVYEFVSRLNQQRENIEHELAKYREKVQHLWKILEEDVKYVNDFIHAHVGINYKTLGAFKKEVKRCEDIRKLNLKEFIEKLRRELLKQWDLAGFSKAQRDEFRESMEDNLYTEDLLTLHDMQINKVKKYMEDNHKIYELLAKRDEMYKKMRELEERANAPDRFKNRGGQLLKEEKERKAVIKKIPSIEDHLLDLASQYEMNHDEKFLYWGESIESLISKAREIIEQEKQVQMSARKMKRDLTMSASKVTPRTLWSNRSPIRSQMSVHRGLLTPHNTKTPLRTPRTAPVRRVVARRSITKAKFRCSAEKKGRIAAIRGMKMKEPNENEIDYSKFEDEMSKRNGFRSTISIHSPHSSKLNPVIRIDTPKTVERKLTAARCATKLHLMF